jgi:hypothetical protein
MVAVLEAFSGTSYIISISFGISGIGGRRSCGLHLYCF